MRTLVTIVLLFSSCVSNHKSLPSSTGTDSEIVVVIIDSLWKSNARELFISVFQKPIKGLATNEKSFNVINVNPIKFNLLLERHTNIIIVSDIDNTIMKKDIWATNQSVFYVNWKKNTQKNKEILDAIYDKLYKKEIMKLKSKLSKKSQKTAENSIKKNFNINVIIPKEYNISANYNNLFWATYNPPKSEEIKQILLFSFIPKNSDISSQIITKIDSVFEKYLRGANDNQYVKIEPDFAPYYFENTLKGIWKLENGFMGGPFIAKTYYKNENIVVSVGVIFDPKNAKRKYVKELQAIL